MPRILAADINHSNLPIGPVGKPSEFQLFFNQMIFKYTKYPKAAKEFLRFMMEEEQIDPWVIGVDRLRDAGPDVRTRRIRSGPTIRSTRRTAIR